jgi:hypothetical protein
LVRVFVATQASLGTPVLHTVYLLAPKIVPRLRGVRELFKNQPCKITRNLPEINILHNHFPIQQLRLFRGVAFLPLDAPNDTRVAPSRNCST